MRKFFKGLAAAALGGAAAVVNDPHVIVNDPKGAGKVALGGAIIAVVAYLIKSPLADGGASQEPASPAITPAQRTSQETGN